MLLQLRAAHHQLLDRDIVARGDAIRAQISSVIKHGERVICEPTGHDSFRIVDVGKRGKKNLGSLHDFAGRWFHDGRKIDWVMMKADIR